MISLERSDFVYRCAFDARDAAEMRTASVPRCSISHEPLSMVEARRDPTEIAMTQSRLPKVETWCRPVSKNADSR